MLKKHFACTLSLALSGIFAACCAGQQSVCATSPQTKLYCLIPQTFGTRSPSEFSPFYTPFGTDLAQLPIARPAGLVLQIRGGHVTTENESLGPIFAGRAETIGAGRLFIGATYQYFNFQHLDGNSLNYLPIVFYLPASNSFPAAYTVTTNRFAIDASQYTFLAAYGLTNKLDLSVAVPVERVAMSINVNGSESTTGSPSGPSGTATFQEQAAGTGSGLGDLSVGGKYTVMDTRTVSLAGGVDVRIPTGDELNFLGSGTVGVRPYIALSRHGAVSPHLNLGYQWNGDSILNADNSGNKQQLPTDFFYVAGADATLHRKVTVVADLLGRRVFNSPRLSTPAPYPISSTYPAITNAESVNYYTSSYTRNDLSVGIKGVVHSRFVFTANLLVKLDNNGLRSNVVPLGGLSYTWNTRE